MDRRYRTKKSISELFDVPIKTLNNDLTEMRRIERFQCYILKPSHKRVYIDVEGYKQFLIYKQKKYEEAM
ncbi:excisionase [Streptococcus anginosus]|uniref:DNA-binding protein n=1 Tax=Streptococcus sanguinis TaxID=1305 RepID=A0A3P1S309_STRSA|nr:DNA-binding protein [Streptococcus sanguinis]RRC91015.1 DNA-binding protein [Streptococcus sanguinis]VTS46866.1 excisionase [Streptococcus anginosus]